MTNQGDSTLDAARLRAEFDATFAAPALASEDAHVELVTIRLGEDRFALRMAQIGSVVADQRVEPVPSAEPAFMGLMADRGRLVPVFRLRALLGYPPATFETDRSWVVCVGTSEPVAFAFDSFAGYLRAHVGSVGDGAAASTPCVAQVVRDANAIVPILDPGLLIAETRRRER
jgi:chemotaxis signal transduction protein